MGYPGTYAKAYDVHVDVGTHVSGTIAGMTLTPMVFESVAGEVDFHYSLWFRQPYQARYLQFLFAGQFWAKTGGPLRLLAWRVLVWNFVYSRWEQTPPLVGRGAGGGAGTLSGDPHGAFVEIAPGTWAGNPEYSVGEDDPWRGEYAFSATAKITSEHIDSQGRAALRLVSKPGLSWDQQEYQVSVRNVRGCRSHFPLPRTYLVRLSTGYTAAYHGTYELVWTPITSAPTTIGSDQIGSWVFVDDGMVLGLGFRHGAWLPIHYTQMAICPSFPDAGIDETEYGLELAMQLGTILGQTGTEQRGFTHTFLRNVTQETDIGSLVDVLVMGRQDTEYPYPRAPMCLEAYITAGSA